MRSFLQIRFLSSLVLAFLILTLDIQTPRGYGDWALYVFPILLLSPTNNDFQLFWLAGITSVLMLLGLLGSPPGLTFSVAIINRIFSYAIVWTVVVIISSRNRSLDREKTAVGERDRLLNEIQIQKNFYELILQTTPVGIAVIRSPDYRYEYANPAYALIPGKMVEDVHEKTVRDIFPDYVAQGGLAFIDQVMQTDTPVHFPELQTDVGFGVDKRRAFFSVSFVPVAPSAKKGPGVLIVASETTGLVQNRLQAEEALRELKIAQEQVRVERDKLKAVIDNISVGVGISDIHGTILFLNPAALSIHEFSNETEMLSRVDQYTKEFELQYPDGTEMPLAEWPLKKALRGEFVHDYEVKLIHRSTNHIRFLRYTITPVYNTDHELLLFVSNITDFTEQKKTEEALRNSEERFRSMADNISQFAWMADPSGWVFWYNKRWFDYTGTTLEQMQGWGWRTVHHPGHIDRVVQKINSCFNTGTFWEDTFPLRDKNGSYRWFLSRAVPIKNQNGKVTLWFGTNTDITDLLEKEEALRESEHRLQILNENLETLVVQRTEQVRMLSKALTLAEQRERKRFSQVLHEDLQQVLFSAKMQVELIKMISESRPPDEEIAQGISESTRLLTKAVNITKDLALELNPPILDSQGFDTALSWLVDYMQRTRNLTIDSTIDEKTSNIRGEKQIMATQMVRELLNNIISHSGVLHATLRAFCREKTLQIVISDKGSGFSVEEARRKPGSENKLGLFSIEERLKLFGGKLIIKSKPGQGTTCALIIPVEQC